MNNLLEKIILILRVLIIGSLLLFIDAFENIGTANLVLIGCSGLGVFLAKKSSTNLNNKKFIVINILLPFIALITFYILNLIPVSDTSNIPLNLAILETHFFNCLLIFQIAFISSFFYYKYFNFIYVEIISVTLFFLALLSGHRNYRFDLLNLVSDLAWYLQLEQLTTVIIISASFFVIVFIYLFLSSLPQRFKQDSDTVFTGKILLPYILSFTGLSLIFILLCQSLYNFHYKEVQTKIRNGVSDEAKEGVSPLNFHSGLGGSSQATAVIRLENDYQLNPYSPLIYFRETAVSNLVENQLVIAHPDLNPDVNNTSPKSYFEQKLDFNYSYREPLKQSIFLLTDHKIAFSVGYPINIVELENKSERFKSVYRAYAMAPTFSFSSFSKNELNNIKFGDPKWDEKTYAHFTKKHPDKRYQEFAENLTKNVESKYSKVRTILDFLTKKSIYTLQPGHETLPSEDPVAPYLFEDLRGYCVHFAHATVYMLRGLGIPARVATGYMSDLSQSKDGHILLRMNDRHAWAEAFVKDLGWIAFDIQPEQVESHAETPVDANLLEELIDMIDPGQELIPEDSGKDEVGLKDKETLNNFNFKYLLYILLLFIILIVLLNTIILNYYKFTNNKIKKLKLFYTSKLLTLKAFNSSRQTGETYKSFLNKLGSQDYKQIKLLDEIYFNPKYKVEESSLNNFIINLSNEESKFSKTYQELEKNNILRILRKLVPYLKARTIIDFYRRNV